MLSFRTGVVLIAFCSMSAVAAAQITPGTVSTEELARALGVVPYCSDARFVTPVYARIVATIIDGTGARSEREVSPASPSDCWRLRVFLFEDVESHRPRRLIFNLDTAGTVAGNAFIDFPADSRLSKVSLTPQGENFYTASVPGDSGPQDKFTVRLRLETSATAFPHPLWESTIKQPVFSKKTAP